MKKYLIVILLGVILTFNCLAEETTMNFLTSDVGARAVGMGKSFTGIADGGEAIFYNPGGVSFVESPGFYTSYYSLSNIDQKSFAFATYYPLENIGILSLNILYMDYGEFIQTNNYGEEIGKYNVYETAIGVSYSTEIIKNLGIGLNLKYIFSQLYKDYYAKNFAFDFGLIYRKDITISRNINTENRIGITFQNIGPEVTYHDAEQSDPLPTYMRFGISSKAKFKWMDLNHYIMGIYGLNKDTVAKIEEGYIYNFGLEYSLNDIFYLRSGYYNDKEGEINGINWGASVKYFNITLDFAFDNTSNLSDNAIKVFSLGYKF